MRLGIFSDVHANLEAMSSVMEAYGDEDIDTYYCLGDVVGYGGSPNECADIVREVAEVTILGNHDAAVAGRMDYSYYYEAAREALDLHARELTPENMAWLRQLPYKHCLEAISVDLCHGSPVRLEEFEYIFAPDQAAECLPIWNDLGHITFIGHSHLSKVFALRPGEVEELPGRRFRPARRHQVHRQRGVRSVSRVITTTVRATRCTIATRARFTSSASSTTSRVRRRRSSARS